MWGIMQGTKKKPTDEKAKSYATLLDLWRLITPSLSFGLTIFQFNLLAHNW